LGSGLTPSFSRYSELQRLFIDGAAAGRIHHAGFFDSRQTPDRSKTLAEKKVPVTVLTPVIAEEES
jgi:hypothetical protein